MTRWSNWSGEHSTRPREVATPRGTAEIINVVRAAAAAGQRLRPVGSSHSWSPLCATDERMISLSRHSRLLSVDPDRCTVTVQGGMRLRELNLALDRHGLALANLGSIDEQTVAGLISTATHGSGQRFGNLSTMVRELEVVDGRGEVVRCSAHEEGELFAAARCAIGALGVIASVTLQCVPAFRLHAVEEVMSFEHVLDRLDRYVADNEHFKLWWIPGNARCLTYRQNRTGQPLRRSRLRKLVDQSVVRGPLIEALLSATAPLPRLAPHVTELMWLSTPGRVTFVDRSFRALSFPVSLKHWECAYAIDTRRAAEALARVARMTRDAELQVNMPIEVRFVRGDDIWLSPAYGRDTCYIGPSLHRSRDYQRYFRAAEEVLGDYDARPHWGKIHFYGEHELSRLYPRWRDFAKVRDRMDPERRFGSDYIDGLLGP